MDDHTLRRLGQRHQRRISAVNESRAELGSAILEARRSGMTLRKIADLTGLSFARVHQIEQEGSRG